LTDSLCCCTECARTCHKGHDCKLKRTSPTAYCDCWEKCKCKATFRGHSPSRYFESFSNKVLKIQLVTFHHVFSRMDCLYNLRTYTDLVKLPNSQGENVLLFLAQTVSRQMVEHRQFRSGRPRKVATTSRKTPTSELEPEMPEHDLDPPR
jgi:E3 ubiquitin-protein ligase EDD1